MKNPTIPVLDIPVHSVYCIGRNYADHAKEMSSPVPDEPILFIKPVSAVTVLPWMISLPTQAHDIHFEAEMVVAIGMEGKDIPEDLALGHVAGYGIGIDFTARDLQAKAKKDGQPWTLSKGMDNFAPIGLFTKAESVPDPQNLSLSLTKNGETCQSAGTADMIFTVSEIISYISKYITLYPGDLIFTGTPAGVGSINKDDELEARLGDDLLLNLIVE